MSDTSKEAVETLAQWLTVQAEAATFSTDAQGFEEATALLRALVAERDAARSDTRVLLACLDWMAEAHGEAVEGEDAAMVEQIRRDLAMSSSPQQGIPDR